MQDGQSGEAIFPTFFMAGFECSTFVWKDRERKDYVAATGHDQREVEALRPVLGSGKRIKVRVEPGQVLVAGFDEIGLRREMLGAVARPLVVRRLTFPDLKTVDFEPKRRYKPNPPPIRITKTNNPTPSIFIRLLLLTTGERDFSRILMGCISPDTVSISSSSMISVVVRSLTVTSSRESLVVSLTGATKR